VFREKKTLSLVQKIQKKKELFPVHYYSKAGGEKAKEESFLSRTYLVVDNSRAPNIARLCYYYYCCLFSSHHFCTCVFECASKRNAFLLSIFRQKFSAQIVKNS